MAARGDVERRRHSREEPENHSFGVKIGAKEENRTPDPRFTKAVHYRCATLALR